MARLIKKHKAFLAAFKATANLSKAAKATGIERSAHYDWLDSIAGYKEAFEAAKDEAAQTLEDEAVRRAHEGVLQAKYYQGKPIGAERVYSDGLMMFLLRGLRPEKYRENVSAELTGKDGGPIQQAMTVTFVRPSADPDDDA